MLTADDRGTEPVWSIHDEQHLVAAFYRNTVIHILVDRAITELALLTVSELDADAELPPGGVLQVGWEEAERLREAGYRRARQCHTWDRRFEELFAKTGILPKR